MDTTLQPRDLAEALDLRAAHPEALPLAGGTDLMVEINFDRRRPERIMDLTRLEELATLERDGDDLVIGAGVTHTRLVDSLGALAPGLAIAARTVGSPQIRNRGTIGGNVATASPAGDALPPLVAAGAHVELASATGARSVPIGAFMTGPKRTTLAPDELITAVRLPAARGPQQFAKVGPRNAMVIAVCSFALTLDAEARTVGAAIGSAAPTVVRATAAEEFLTGVLDEGDLWERRTPIGDAAAARFGELVGAAAQPIDDVRGSAAYRRHALAVLGRRTLGWCWEELAA
ncbi:FAD binding domain-containing protein [Miltoncostaea oceani]|uniref:FAD binding domain-containing protein n=1 Tax=Miltoncostaea oceani TaxID=2843216 RepID=UPI001C3CFB29|nr:FAD binding domain-containing protein [Miltoncostaea oceani]